MALPGRGMGVVASRDISQGDLIIREKPLFLSSVPVSTSSPGAILLAALAPLSPTQRASFYNLSYSHFPEGVQKGTARYNEELALAIFQNNAVSAGESTGIFPRMARLNHGCSHAFNVVYAWRDYEGVLVVHALKPIKEGQELLTTYTDTKRPQHVRRQFLLDHYGFDCRCAACRAPSDDLVARSDQRLGAMSELYAQFSGWQHGRLNGSEAAAVAISIWNLGEEEGYWSERGQLAADVVHIAAAHSDASAVHEWARLAQTWFGYELGGDSVQAQQMGQLASAAGPQLHMAWGTRAREAVGGPRRGCSLRNAAESR
ncbi:uncharacterized protein TRAVEDRAFT_121744 [Trametes versicolor FP-101664 SS1]|uniref:uncharacterized protein n=1 Tax=Trametes versicolor (strain FP-101664) TaxID=717944 RepID=UPI00046228E5|nr:uncharacterized protein TRAVEDRAFT_121744 [Trametes versicolor FP-101664 SS1]EIW59597.1 hypothetical protein TRAVEDRAFT_121744 [Trametes versicolor FP-101664 SS1]